MTGVVIPTPILDPDIYLVRMATLSGALVLANYLFWSAHAPFFMQSLAVTCLWVAIGFFLVKPPVFHYWPIKLFLICATLMSLATPTPAWDARSIWLFHAKRIFTDNNMYSQLDGYAAFSHNDYPLLVPALAASLAKMVGQWNEVFPKVSSILALAPAILVLAAVLRSHLQQLLLCCLLLFVCGGFLINGYMDAIMAVYFTAASLLIVTLTKSIQVKAFAFDERLWQFVLAGIVFAGLSLLKNEGLAALGALVLATVLTSVVFRCAGNTLAIATIALVSIAPILAWKILCANSGISNDLTQGDLIAQISRRVFSISDYRHILSGLLGQKQFLVPFALFLVAAYGTAERRVFGFIFLCALIYGGIIFMVYLATPMDLRWHLSTSVNRTILPIALILGYYFVVDQIENVPPRRQGEPDFRGRRTLAPS